jgi:hypothetical protein
LRQLPWCFRAWEKLNPVLNPQPFDGSTALTAGKLRAGKGNFGILAKVTDKVLLNAERTR